jgi:hypothetical protein
MGSADGGARPRLEAGPLRDPTVLGIEATLHRGASSWESTGIGRYERLLILPIRRR